MRQAALVIPNLPGQLGLPPSLVCVQVDTGTEPNRISAYYTDTAFWRGERKQLEAVAAAMRTAAERAGIREIQISVSDGERSQRLGIVWERQRGWLESLMAVEEARPDPQPSGTVVSFQACVEMNPRDGRPFLGVRYRSRLPRNGVKRMAPEAHRVFDVVVEEAERREIVTVFVSPMDARGFSSGLGYYRTEDGLWSRPFTSDVPEKPLGLQEGPPLTPEELESIREAVSAIPNLLAYGGVPKAAYCAGADTGFLPTHVTMEYADPSFWRGDRHQFEEAAAAMRAEAEKAGIREVEITVRDGGRSQLYRIIREPDGGWSEPVLMPETAEEMPETR
jgi:nucleotide-binding universal stress UspA family protein